MKQYYYLRFILASMIFTAFTEKNCFSAEQKASIELSKLDIEPPESEDFYTQEKFNLLNKLAQAGSAKAQYALAKRLLEGNNPYFLTDFIRAEQWALKAREKDYLPAYILLVDIANSEKKEDKQLNYALEAINRGFAEQNFNVGIIYESKKEFKKAREYYQKAYGTKYGDDALYNFGRLLQLGLGGDKDISTAMSIYKKLSAKNNIIALYALGREYLLGNEVVRRNLSKAYEYLKKATDQNPPNNKVIVYNNCLISLGLLVEKGFDNHKPNPAKAAEYFAKAQYNTRGSTHIARLIWTKKIPGNSALALQTLQNNRQLNDIMANFIYGLIKIGEGNPKEAVDIFELLLPSNDIFPAALLQLGIAYYYGFGVDQNKEKAELYFDKILKISDKSPYRSTLLARGYLYLFGLGVPQDIKRGLELIDASEKEFDDLFFSTEQLFPAITKLRTELHEKAVQEFIAPKLDKKRQAKKSKKAKKAAKTIELSSTEETLGTSTSTESSKQNVFNITPDEWNSYFVTNDCSSVSEINPLEKTITIEDPKRQERLIIKGHDLPIFELNQIETLQMAPRISKRQGVGRKSKTLKKSTIYDHSFAEMLDYVIQYVGEYVPFFKNGSEMPEDSLIAEVKRIDIQTGQEIDGVAEYTFRKKHDGFEVYHRLLRRKKQPAIAYFPQDELIYTNYLAAS